MTSTQQGTETIVYMPPLGESVEEGTVTRWLKQPGERIEEEEPLLEVATDKVDTEIPAPSSGVLIRTFANENDVVAVGAELAVIAADVVTAPPVLELEPTVARPVPPAVVSSSPQPPTTQLPAADSAINSVPAVPPSAPNSRNSPDYIRTEPDSSGSTPQKLPRLRRTIATRMVESLRISAQLTTVVEVDLGAVAALRNHHKAEFHSRTGVKLSFLPFFVRAAIAALPNHPTLNASLNADVTEVTYHDTYHLGVAVDAPKGLVVPVIRDIEQLSLAGIAQRISDVADKVRTGTITPDELVGGTFTITNTGSRGALFDTPILNQPQTGILGTGAVVERLVPRRDGNDILRIEARPMVHLSLTYDHRIVYGADAARYLGAVKAHLESGFANADVEE